MTEQVESLAALEVAGRAVDAQAAASVPPVPGQLPSVAALSPQQMQDATAAELLAALTMARAMAFPILGAKGERLKAVWTDDVLQNAAGAGAAVMQLHGLTMGALSVKYAPYIALAAALAPPLIQTRKILAEPEPEPKEKPAEGQGA